MQIPRFVIKFVLNIFPPLLFNRIVLKEISDDFLEMKVVLRRSLFNINFHKTIFGGSIFSACDPYFPTMYYHIFANKKRKLIIWLKSAEIQYLKPADSTLKLYFKITKEDIHLAENTLNEKGKFEIWHTVEAINKKGVVCARAKMQVYLSDDNRNEKLGF
ncbi:MAG: YiiD C-terminal domain-containing protein [Pelagibacterales bacterium]|nr:YiiD C-terminal domain-containing protein [Pelagibacterales bacterium]